MSTKSLLFLVNRLAPYGETGLQTVIDEQTLVVNLRHQHSSTLLGLPAERILVSWQIQTPVAGLSQRGYQIQASENAKFDTPFSDTLLVASDRQSGIASGVTVDRSRTNVYIRVRIQTEAGLTAWSQPISYETGLTSPKDWKAKMIGAANAASQETPIFRKEIVLRDKPISARLYISAMGLYSATVNAVAVTASVLNPGWTAYENRLLTDTYDVTNLLNEGHNCLGLVVSEGWWKGKLGFMNGSEHYGHETGVIAQLEVQYPNGVCDIFSTDESWKQSHSEITASSIYDGTTQDFRLAKPGWQSTLFDDRSWNNSKILDFDLGALMPRTAPQVNVVAEHPLALEIGEERVLLRGVQNISGWVRLSVRGKAGQTVTVRHSEVLEADGSLHVRALRSAKATDTYVLGSDGIHLLEPKFTFHGFQYAEVLTDATVLSATAVAISSLASRRGYFNSSNTHLNKLHENVVWSQLDNFVSLPTDCPQRDERMGWTGDAQAFANTANTLFHCQEFWQSWLYDLRLEQRPNGDVPAVVPDLMKFYPNPEGWIMEGRAGWGDAATIVPMSVYRHYGETHVLEDQLDSMIRWVDALDKRRQGNDLLPSEFQFGDWCDPDAPGDKPWESKVSPDFVANAFFAHSARLVSDVLELLGDSAQSAKYSDLAKQVSASTWKSHGALAVNTTAGCAIALELGIAPSDQREEVASHLAKMVIFDDARISTGFLATPLILDALSKNGHASLALQMLLRRGFRSWLYAVDKGATTVWERWDAITEDGKIHSGSAEEHDSTDDIQDDNAEGGSMLSFNHYAYGAVIDWVYRNLVGISQTQQSAGFETIILQPLIPRDMPYASASIESPRGLISSSWKLVLGQGLQMRVRIPFGAKAILALPTTDSSLITANGAFVENGQTLYYGEYQINVSNPKVTDFKVDF